MISAESTLIVTSIIRFSDTLTNAAIRAIAFYPFDLGIKVNELVLLSYNVTTLLIMISHSFEGFLYYMVDKNMQSVLKHYTRKFICK